MFEFRLIYQGPLKAGANESRADDKQAIRRVLHPQLKELHSQYDFLSVNVPFFSKQFSRAGFNFVPLINRMQGKYCAIDILFLRRDAPGNLVVSGGDLDNRIKLLFDGLKTPKLPAELGTKDVPMEGEDPFYTLLEDDALITKVSITTDRLLTPRRDGERINDVILVMHVTSEIPRMDATVEYGPLDA
jgi:hypothetical protein